MIKKKIYIQFKNGLSHRDFLEEVLAPAGIESEFEFLESDKPDFIVFGPYGNDLPPPGDYIRIGYFCENIMPDLEICEWAFGVPAERLVNSARYARIQWHALRPELLVKDWDDNEIDRLFEQKTLFCNFLYSNPVRYRETFFKQLSKYKRVDAPGRSMNNMPTIDGGANRNTWESKRSFLAPYKFTIAFENYSYPGYQTEKLYDAMRCASLPVYCGDPEIGQVFNTASFLNVADYLPLNRDATTRFLENAAQMNFRDYRPSHHFGLWDKVIRKIKAKGRKFKMERQFNNLDFTPVIDRIIMIDKDPALYKEYLRQPWFNNNVVPSETLNTERWRQIFNSEPAED